MKCLRKYEWVKLPRDYPDMGKGLLSVRNLGQKSAKEIKMQFFEECYSRLLPYEKAQYWQEVLDSLR